MLNTKIFCTSTTRVQLKFRLALSVIFLISTYKTLCCFSNSSTHSTGERHRRPKAAAEKKNSKINFRFIRKTREKSKISSAAIATANIFEPAKKKLFHAHLNTRISHRQTHKMKFHFFPFFIPVPSEISIFLNFSAYFMPQKYSIDLNEMKSQFGGEIFMAFDALKCAVGGVGGRGMKLNERSHFIEH